MSKIKERSSHKRNELIVEAITTKMTQVFDSHLDSIRREYKRARPRKEPELKAKPPDNTLRSTWSSPQRIPHILISKSMIYSDYHAVKLYKFSGKGDYLKWEKNMDDWLYHNKKVLRSDRLTYALSQLTGDAYKWWLKEVDDRWYYKEPSITSWRELKNLLRNKYVPQVPNRAPQANAKVKELAVQGKKPAIIADQNKTSTLMEDATLRNLLEKLIKESQNEKVVAKSTSQPKKATEKVVVHEESLKPSLDSSAESKQCKSSKLSKSRGVTCYNCREKGHFAVNCPGKVELTNTSLESKLSSSNSSSEVVNQGLENSNSCVMHLFLSKDVDSGYIMEHENDKSEGITKERNQHSVSATSQAWKADHVSNITIFKSEMLPNFLRGAQISLNCEFIQYLNNFTFIRSLKQPVLNVEISSITRLIFPLRSKEDTGSVKVCNGKKRTTSIRSLAMDQAEKVTRCNYMPSNSELMSVWKETRAMEKHKYLGELTIKEKPPDLHQSPSIYKEFERGTFKSINHEPANTKASSMFKDKPPDAILISDYHKISLKCPRRIEKREEDKRFKPPNLDQDIHPSINNFIMIKEAPPDATNNPKPNRSQGKCNMSSSFNTELVSSCADKTDLRSNLFQVGEDDVIMASKETKETEENKEELEPELNGVKDGAKEQLGVEDVFRVEKEYGKDVILTSLVLIHDHQMGMCLICTLFPLSSFVPLGFLDKVFNEANVSHSNHPFVDPAQGITFINWPNGLYIKYNLFSTLYKPKKSPNQVVYLLVKGSDENRSARVIFAAKKRKG